MIASGDGHIVNISSLFGLVAVPGQSAYNAAKFAVRGFTEALRQEMFVSGHPVKVTCVHPGGIKTAVARNATVCDGQDAHSVAAFFDRRLALHSPEMAAKTIADSVRKGRARVVIGWEAEALDALARVTGLGVSAGHRHGGRAVLPWAGDCASQVVCAGRGVDSIGVRESISTTTSDRGRHPLLAVLPASRCAAK